jgi:hypothetical protein
MRLVIRIVITALFALLPGPLVALGLGLVAGLSGWIGSTVTIWKRLK